MLIQCTKKLQDQLKIKPSREQVTEDPLYSWHAHLLIVQRRKAVMLVNDQNRYIIMLYGLRAKEFKKLDDLIVEAIQEVFRAEQIKDEVIEQYFQQAPTTTTYTKTKDRTSVARMNKSIENAYAFGDLLDENAIIQTDISFRASRLLVGDGENGFIVPHEVLLDDLAKLTGQFPI